MIEVHNPDATVATHQRFRERTRRRGANALAQILSGTGIAGTFLIQAGNSVAASSPCTPQGCLLFQTYDVNGSLNGYPGFKTLTVTTPAGANPYSGDLVLSGELHGSASRLDQSSGYIVGCMFTHGNGCL